MRILSSLIIAFLTGVANAQVTNEVLGGSLTQHFTNFDGVSKRFSNKISADGTLIANPLIGYRRVDQTGQEYISYAAFGGMNSVGEALGGGAASFGVVAEHVRLGLTGGGYLQNDRRFKDRGVTPFSIQFGSDLGLVPIVGVEFSLDVNLSDRTYLTIYNLVTPILSNTTIGIGWKL